MYIYIYPRELTNAFPALNSFEYIKDITDELFFIPSIF